VGGDSWKTTGGANDWAAFLDENVICLPGPGLTAFDFYAASARDRTYSQLRRGAGPQTGKGSGTTRSCTTTYGIVICLVRPVYNSETQGRNVDAVAQVTKFSQIFF